MSDDLVKRLRAYGPLTMIVAANRIEQVEAELIRTNRLMMADAKRVEQLEAELHNCFHRIEELQAALREIVNCCTLPAQNDFEMREIARTALEGKKDD